MTGLDDLRRKNDDLRRKNEALHERTSRLAAAVRQINASLDPDTVLHEIVESTRVLTGARIAVIATIDEAGEPDDFTSSGLTPEEQRTLAAWPDGPRLFEHFRNLPGTLRLPDARAYVRSLGYALELVPPAAFQGTPMSHRGEYVGSFFVVAKEGGGEFTSEDEEVLVLLASQAATAIANARTHRAERRAPGGPEGLGGGPPGGGGGVGGGAGGGGVA
ncbi:MAG: GAF domain-containing protein, partial [Spirochaetaceae bacterium]|nr:GAF domain-containing protein [Spirochaetaceae bacterium]